MHILNQNKKVYTKSKTGEKKKIPKTFAQHRLTGSKNSVSP